MHHTLSGNRNFYVLMIQNQREYPIGKNPHCVIENLSDFFKYVIWKKSFAKKTEIVRFILNFTIQW